MKNIGIMLTILQLYALNHQSKLNKIIHQVNLYPKIGTMISDPIAQGITFPKSIPQKIKKGQI